MASVPTALSPPLFFFSVASLKSLNFTLLHSTFFFWTGLVSSFWLYQSPALACCSHSIWSFGTFLPMMSLKTLSALKAFGRGIKQGCPLNPYLFIMVLSALTADLNEIFVTLFHSMDFFMSPSKFRHWVCWLQCSHGSLQWNFHASSPSPTTSCFPNRTSP